MTISDPLAAHHAERHLGEILRDAATDRCSADDAARAYIGQHDARFERENGLRRVVLVGAWEVDPAAVARAGRPVVGVSA